jgi:Fe-S cluster assembly iron-binding protein IscA
MMVHVTGKAQQELEKFFSENEGLDQSIRIYLEAGG